MVLDCVGLGLDLGLVWSGLHPELTYNDHLSGSGESRDDECSGVLVTSSRNFNISSLRSKVDACVVVVGCGLLVTNVCRGRSAYSSVISSSRRALAIRAPSSSR